MLERKKTGAQEPRSPGSPETQEPGDTDYATGSATITARIKGHWEVCPDLIDLAHAEAYSSLDVGLDLFLFQRWEPLGSLLLPYLLVHAEA